MAIETELKLLIAAKDITRFKRHPLLENAQIALVEQELYNTYFDTPQHDLLQSGAGLRVRRIGEQHWQTLKTRGHSVSGLHQRYEWEMEIEGDQPILKKLPKSFAIKGYSTKQLQALLVPVFTTDFKRTTWHLQLEDGVLIELALDQGEIRSGEHSDPICEIELELKAGEAADLYRAALLLQEHIPLSIENRSKAMRGYDLYDAQEISPSKAESFQLSPKDSAEAAFVRIAWHCLQHWQANHLAILASDDIEGVHQMRVALRRLRSCFSWYKALIPLAVQADLNAEIKWLTAILGTARDWDVFALALSKIAEAAPESEQAALKSLQAQVATQQAEAYKAVRSTLVSSRYQRLLLQLGHWLTGRKWQLALSQAEQTALQQPVGQFAPMALHKRYKKLLKMGASLRQLPALERHEVRIAVKKLAYGIRFFSSLYSAKASDRYSRHLSSLQDVLGELNDIQVTEGLLQQLGVATDAPVAHFLRGWYSHQQCMQLDQLDVLWQQFAAQTAFWK